MFYPRSWRFKYLIPIGCALVIALAFIHKARLVGRQLFEDGSPYIIDPTLVLDSSGRIDQNGTQLVPKIIHQTYADTSIPENWRQGQQNCKDLHPDYAYMFWTDELALSFISSSYPWFVNTFVSYRYPIQRVDALRYFLLYHYGGIYLDLDIEPYRRLDPLLSYPAWGCRTAPIGISNDVLGATPGHPFYRIVINSLQAYNRDFKLPYLTIMYSTGPLFLSSMWTKYIHADLPENDVFWVLSRDTHYEATYGFFYNHTGSSWHEWDARIILWIYEHYLLATISGLVGFLGLTSTMWYSISRAGQRRNRLILNRTD